MSPAQEVLAARARRRTTIRNRVAAAVLATFALAWGAVVWDGSMGTSTTTAQTTTPSSDQGTTRSGDDGTSSSSSQDSPGTLSTHQS